MQHTNTAELRVLKLRSYPHTTPTLDLVLESETICAQQQPGTQ
jgi:hypothetical protein